MVGSPDWKDITSTLLNDYIVGENCVPGETSVKSNGFSSESGVPVVN